METNKTVQTFSKDHKSAMQQDAIHQLKTSQLSGEREQITANRRSDIKIDKTSAAYVHVLATIKHLNNSSKDFKRETRTIKIHATEFDRRCREGAFKTYDEVEVIHDPRGGDMDNSEYNKLMKPGAVVNTAETEKSNVNRAVESASKLSKDLKDKEKNLNQFATELSGKAEELSSKENALTEKEISINDRLAELKQMEEEIARQKEELAKATPSAPIATAKDEKKEK